MTSPTRSATLLVNQSTSPPDCGSCPLATRRDFLVSSSLALAAIATALGIGTRESLAMPVRLGWALVAQNGELTYDIPATDGAVIDKTNEVILVRNGNAVYAFSLSCPHQNTALHWLDKEHIFQCPKHKSRYQPDGTFISGRATRGMDRFAIRKQDNHILVSPDTLLRQDKDGAKWKDAMVTL